MKEIAYLIGGVLIFIFMKMFSIGDMFDTLLIITLSFIYWKLDEILYKLKEKRK